MCETDDPAELRATVLAEAKGLLTEEFEQAIDRVFQLHARAAGEQELKDSLRHANRNDPSADAVAAAGYLRAIRLKRRRLFA